MVVMHYADLARISVPVFSVLGALAQEKIFVRSGAEEAAVRAVLLCLASLSSHLLRKFE